MGEAEFGLFVLDQEFFEGCGAGNHVTESDAIVPYAGFDGDPSADGTVLQVLGNQEIVASIRMLDMRGCEAYIFAKDGFLIADVDAEEGSVNQGLAFPLDRVCEAEEARFGWPRDEQAEDGCAIR